MHSLDLRTYLDRLPAGGVRSFARRLGIHRVYLAQLAARQKGREPSPQLCVCIEQQSDGLVKRPALRPADWHLIWPELVNTEGAPPVPSNQAQEVRDAA